MILGGLFGFLAYRENTSSTAFKLYATSAALLTSIVPYTLALMGTTNQKLLEKSESLASASITDAAAEAGVAKEETVHALVDKWAMLNLGRGIMAATSAALALWASIESVQIVELNKLVMQTGANRMS